MNKAETLEKFEELWRESIKVCGHQGTDLIYKLEHGALNAFTDFLSSALDACEQEKQKAVEEAKRKTLEKIAGSILTIPTAKNLNGFSLEGAYLAGQGAILIEIDKLIDSLESETNDNLAQSSHSPTEEECNCECHGFSDGFGRENCFHCMPWLYPEKKEEKV